MSPESIYCSSFTSLMPRLSFPLSLKCFNILTCPSVPVEIPGVYKKKIHHVSMRVLHVMRLRGRPFDPEGKAWQIWSGQIIYFHHWLSRKIYFLVNRGQNIYFQPQQIFYKQKTKTNKK